MIRIVLLVIGYFVGTFETGYIYGKIANKDIRQAGSGNTGATNALRVLGLKAGVIVFLGDGLKALIYCTIIRLVFSASQPDYFMVYMLYGGLGVVIGHNYPFYLGFNGGKGIAATAGVIASLDIRITLAVLIAFIAAVLITRIVSIGSLLVVSIFLVMWIAFGQLGMLNIGSAALPESYVLVILFTGMAVWRHRGNIKRLLNGTENKFGSSKKQ